MAVVPVVMIPTGSNPFAANGVVIHEWVGLAASGDVGVWVAVPHFSDKTVQVSGSFGTGGVVDIEGSIDDPTEAAPAFETLADPQGNDISIATADKKLETILDNCVFIRPRMTAGSGASLTVRLLSVTTR